MNFARNERGGVGGIGEEGGGGGGGGGRCGGGEGGGGGLIISCMLNSTKEEVAQKFRKKAEQEAEKIPFHWAMLTLLAQEKIYRAVGDLPGAQGCNGLGHQGRHPKPGHPRQPGQVGGQGGPQVPYRGVYSFTRRNQNLKL